LVDKVAERLGRLTVYPGVHAETKPDHPALIMAETGQSVTYRELNRRSLQLACPFDK
jgi:acyl-CoA synthetase (AMP-forming)/AMP-acid ligase II